MTKKKLMMAAMSTALVAVVGVGGTLAYLSAQSDVVSNVFTVGTGYETVGDDVGIRLDELKVQADGTIGPERVTDVQQTYPELMPGDTKEKDPTVWFVDGSVKSYVFVKVEGTAKAAENHLVIKDGEKKSAWNTADWLKIYESDGTTEATTTEGDGYYIYKGKYADTKYVIDREDQKVALTELGDVFDYITFADVNNEEFESIQPNFNDSKITVAACAVQAADDGTKYKDAFKQATFKSAN